jgi:hypothetical protein
MGARDDLVFDALTRELASPQPDEMHPIFARLGLGGDCWNRTPILSINGFAFSLRPHCFGKCRW